MRAKGEDCANKWSMCDDHIKGLNFSVEDVLYEWVSGGVSRSLESKSNSGGGVLVVGGSCSCRVDGFFFQSKSRVEVEQWRVSGCFSRKEHKGRKGGRGVVVVLVEV